MFMSVTDKRERKLPGLLVEDSVTSTGESRAEFERTRYKLRKFRENKPEVYASLLSKYLGVISEIKQAINVENKKN